MPEETSVSNTHTLTVKYLDKLPSGRIIDNQMEWLDQEVEKEATFMELDRRSKKQAALQAHVLAVCQSMKITDPSEDNFKLTLDPTMMSEVADMYIRLMLIPDTSFTKKDKDALLMDNIGVIRTGNKLFYEKMFPFFLTTLPKAKDSSTISTASETTLLSDDPAFTKS
jgi:hypothetical protein